LVTSRGLLYTAALGTIWQVNEQRLDDRIEEQRDLVAIAGRSVIPPSEEKF
jgi:hypothetical protein